MKVMIDLTKKVSDGIISTEWSEYEEQRTAYGKEMDALNIHGNRRKMKMKKFNAINKPEKEYLVAPEYKTTNYEVEVIGKHLQSYDPIMLKNQIRLALNLNQTNFLVYSKKGKYQECQIKSSSKIDFLLVNRDSNTKWSSDDLNTSERIVWFLKEHRTEIIYGSESLLKMLPKTAFIKHGHVFNYY